MTQRKNLVKYTLKDSIFTNLFSHPEYLLQLYKTLHPEDTEATEDSLTDITVFCKHFLDKIAKYFWTLLHVQIGQSCNGVTG